MLGSCLGIAPAEVVIERDANGKPRLGAGCADLRFNLSHSGRVALVAVRLGFEVGVDVEQVRPGVDGAAVWREVCAPCERVAFGTHAGGPTGESFFRSWVRREALAKAAGGGIVAPPEPAAAARFTVCDLDGIPGYAAAVASEGAGWGVRRWQEISPPASGACGVGTIARTSRR